MIIPNKDFRAGDDASRFTAGDYRLIAEYLEALGALSVVSPLQLSNGDRNRIISFPHKRGFWARVIGAQNPYGFLELRRDDSLGLVPNGSGYAGSPTPTVGDLKAYEVNNVIRLDNTIQWLEPGYDDDYRFQDVSNGTAHPPPACWPTVHLQDCHGSPISGATVTITSCPRITALAPIVGTTDASGNYLFPLDGVPAFNAVRYNCYSISHDGVTTAPFFGISDSVANCDNPLKFCYDKASIVVTVTGDPTATVTFANVPLPNTTTTSGGTTTMTYKRITYCSVGTAFPRDFSVLAEPSDPAYLSNCASGTLHCNDALNITLDLYNYTACYHKPDSVMLSAGCYCEDKGCTYGPGPNGRGLYSKKYQARFTSTPVSITSGTTTNPNYFADDEGVWIDLDYVGSGTWASVCRDGRGNYQSLRNQDGGNPVCSLNRPLSPELVRIPYGSTNVVMGCQGIRYTRFGTADCTVVAHCDNKYIAPGSSGLNCGCLVQNDGTLCSPCFHGATLDGGAAGGNHSGSLCVPSNFTVLGFFTGFSSPSDFKVDIRETC